MCLVLSINRQTFHIDTVAQELTAWLGRYCEVHRAASTDDADEVHVSDAVHVKIDHGRLICCRWCNVRQGEVAAPSRETIEALVPDVLDALRTEAATIAAGGR